MFDAKLRLFFLMAKKNTEFLRKKKIYAQIRVQKKAKCRSLDYLFAK